MLWYQQDLDNGGQRNEHRAKTLLFLVLVLTGMAPTACNYKQTPLPQISVSETIKNPAAHLHKRAAYVDGVVIFKHQEKGISAVVIIPHPFPRVQSVDSLRDEDVLVVKTARRDYQKVDIGDVIRSEGRLTKATSKGKTVFYIKSSNTSVTGKENIKDPDFKTLIDIVAKKGRNDDLKMLFTYWAMMILLT